MNESRLETAMMAPLRSGRGRCWIIAFSGTTKNPAKKPRSASRVKVRPKVSPKEIKQHAEDGHAGGAERDESVLDLVAGEISGGEAAKADPRAVPAISRPNVRFVRAED